MLCVPVCDVCSWINDENPLERATRHAQQNNFATPLGKCVCICSIYVCRYYLLYVCICIDEIDAAARILDPMFAPLIEAAESSGGDVEVGEYQGKCSPPFGCFLKDYFVTEW